MTAGIVAPTSGGMISGLSTFFDTGAPHLLAKYAILQETAAFHVAIGTGERSISTQIATLRHLLFGNGEGALARVFEKIVWVSLGVPVFFLKKKKIQLALIQMLDRGRFLSLWTCTAPTSWVL